MTKSLTDTSVRLDIINYVLGLYKAATATSPAPAGKTYYGVDFSVIQPGPLGDPDAKNRSAVGIVAGPEKKSALFPVWQNMFDLNIEFRVTRQTSDPLPAILAEQFLAVIQQIIYDDNTLGGKVIKIDEVGNEVDLNTYADRTIVGVVKFTIEYRHGFTNVYSTTPAV